MNLRKYHSLMPWWNIADIASSCNIKWRNQSSDWFFQLVSSLELQYHTYLNDTRCSEMTFDELEISLDDTSASSRWLIGPPRTSWTSFNRTRTWRGKQSCLCDTNVGVVFLHTWQRLFAQWQNTVWSLWHSFCMLVQFPSSFFIIPYRPGKCWCQSGSSGGTEYDFSDNASQFEITCLTEL